MDYQVSLLPEISISFAPPSEPTPEPFSPFSQPPTPSVTLVDDGYRSNLLSPPPAVSPRFQRQHSPLCPDSMKNNPGGQGLEPDRFQRLLASSREQNSAVNGKRAPDLRKEIAIKAHKTKQIERRALFLSKINAPPSPSATFVPKTPPESPAIFHYTRRSPGLESPLSVYEALDSSDCAVTPWVEQVDFRREPGKKPRTPALPSLDQISAHLSSHGHGSMVQHKPRSSRAPLPAFLRSVSPPGDADPVPAPVAKPPMRVFLNQPPTPRPFSRVAPPAKSPVAQSFVELMPPPPRIRRIPPPLDPISISVTTTVVPRMARTSPVQLTESNLALLSSRTRTGLDMMSALRRRTSSGSHYDRPATTNAVAIEELKARRRISAPAELQRRPHDDFTHPVLALPGGF
ncbi:hypothetical protein K488DRAFT_40829 [Vararia minispora EC-137]|uniref:Uncharacterized protein n=1 Tax=Vararia minispora EC-137 TaxID=1314806 RepID=A0ACB8QXV5_9AGAM|nr:hypothetical protein K488DRAFT_40829 [Vararia minispora EC-137]